jgi:ABC-type phosphate transport system permease subunit
VAQFVDGNGVPLTPLVKMELNAVPKVIEKLLTLCANRWQTIFYEVVLPALYAWINCGFVMLGLGRALGETGCKCMGMQH